MISVCIATYNGEKYIEEQLFSILHQLDPNDEIIISDDFSIDSTIDVIKKINDCRIKIFFNQKKRIMSHPAISNFENALSQAKGDYIFLADQDDIWQNNKISQSIHFLQKFDMVVSDCLVIDQYGNKIIPSFFEFNNSKKGLINNLIKNNYMGCCMAFRRNVLKKSLPFPKDIPLHDLWIGFVAELFYKTIFINDKLIIYRRHENASSYTGSKSQYSFTKKLSFRLNCIKYIPIIISR